MAVFSLQEQYLSGNPIVIKVSELGTTPRVISFELYKIDQLIFSGSAYSLSGEVSLSLSGLFKKLMYPGCETYKIKIIIGNETEDTYLQDINIYAGAINSLLQHKLHASGANIFDAKLNASENNFFLTTRSFSRFIFIPENELLPLYFYKKGKKFTLKYGAGQTLYDYSDLEEDEPAALDLNAIRENHFNASGELVNIFDVIPEDGILATTTIIITEAKESNYFIKFRNSLAAMEKISLDDLIEMQAEFSSEEMMEFDDVLNIYTPKTHDSHIKTVYRAFVAAKSNKELLWIIDMLLSKEQYFMVGRHEYPAIVRTEQPVLQTTEGIPLSVPIEIRLIATDSAFSPTNIDTSMDVGIFSDEFNEIFY